MDKSYQSRKHKTIQRIVLLSFVFFFTNAEAAFSVVRYNIDSIGSDGSTASGFIEWVDTAPDIGVGTLEGTTGFRWEVSGGVNNMLIIDPATNNVLEFSWDALSNGLSQNFSFLAGLGVGSFIVPTGTPFTNRLRIANTDVIYTHTLTLQPVPIPGAIVLLGSGLVGLFGFTRRNKLL